MYERRGSICKALALYAAVIATHGDKDAFDREVGDTWACTRLVVPYFEMAGHPFSALALGTPSARQVRCQLDFPQLLPHLSSPTSPSPSPSPWEQNPGKLPPTEIVLLGWR